MQAQALPRMLKPAVQNSAILLGGLLVIVVALTALIVVGPIAALLLLFAGNPWPLLGWLLHISADRLMGFGLRGEDGGQALI